MQLSPISENLLLRAASRTRRPGGQLKQVVFEAGERLWNSEAPIAYALFPTRGVVSLQVSAGGEKNVDVALLGREGYAEVPFFLGAKRTRVIAVALTAGEALVMPPELFRRYLGDPGFHEAMERYTRMFLVMLNQISVCNRAHVIEKTFI